MTNLLICILNMSIAGSIVAIIVMLIRLPIRKLPKIFSYLLWCVVFLRLICPVQIVSKLSLMPTNNEIIPVTIVTSEKPQINSGIKAVDNTVNSYLVDVVSKVSTLDKVNSIAIILEILSFIWILGVSAMILYTIIGYIRIKQRIYDATLVSDNIYETDKITAAFVFGFIHPKIYVSTALKHTQRDIILKHERIHIKRRDYLIKAIAFLILFIHWFNPIVWISYHLMSKDMEMSCDEAVLRKADSDIRQDYSLSMIDLYTKKMDFLKPFTSWNGSVKSMKVRIKNVLKFKKTKYHTILIASIFVLLFTVVFIVNPIPDTINQTIVKADTETENSKTPYFKTYSQKSEAAVSAYSRTNNWAMASSLTGATHEQFLDSKLEFLEDVWEKEKKPFIFVEGISEDEISDTESLQYMYEKSSIYRKLLNVKDTLFIRPETTFYKMSEGSAFYERVSFYLPETKKLSLKASYKLDEGNISIFVVSPSGKVEYQNDFTNKFNKTITVSLNKGISSVILAYETETNKCGGQINIMGTIKK